MDQKAINEVIDALPKSQKKMVSAETMQLVTDMLNDPDMCESYREGLLSYTHVMREGKYKIESYINAIKYVSQKMMNKTNEAAFSATFPDKIAKWQTQGLEAKDVASYISAYNRGKLVSKLLQQVMVPFYVRNQDNYQKAIDAQVRLMTTATSEKVQSDAANSILNHLKPPEAAKVELDVTVKNNSAIDDLRAKTQELVAAQKNQIANGLLTAQDIAHQEIVGISTEDIEDAEFEEVTT